MARNLNKVFTRKRFRRDKNRNERLIQNLTLF
jgi:hypothetical protein